MQTRRRTYRTSLRLRAGRLVAGALPLLTLLQPTAATARDYVEIAICSGGSDRVMAIPRGQSPTRHPEDQQGGCAHFVCPRERALGDPGDDDEE
jgi:hypothetical protein